MPLVPVASLALPLLPPAMLALVSSNFAAAPLVPVVPAVPAVPVSVARSTHPLTVIVLPFADVEVPGV